MPQLCGLISLIYRLFKGVLEEDFVNRLLQPEFLEALVENKEESKTWENRYRKSVNDSLRESLVENVGKSIEELFT